MIVVSVGTDHHPFPRLLTAVATWAGANGHPELWVQHGYSAPVPGAENHAFVARETLLEMIRDARVVVTQVGPGTILDTNSVGRRPIAMPRDPALGEHVDRHQFAFGAAMHSRGAATVVHEEQALKEALDAAWQDGASTHTPVRVSPAPQTARALAERIETLVSTPARRFYPARVLPTVRRLPVPGRE